MSIVDLNELRDRKGSGDEMPRVPGNAFYANDLQVSIDGGAVVSVEFFFVNNKGVRDPVTVSMPAGIFMELANLAPRVGQEIQNKMQQMAAAAAQRGSQPSTLEDARRERDQ